MNGQYEQPSSTQVAFCASLPCIHAGISPLHFMPAVGSRPETDERGLLGLTALLHWGAAANHQHCRGPCTRSGCFSRLPPHNNVLGSLPQALTDWALMTSLTSQVSVVCDCA